MTVIPFPTLYENALQVGAQQHARFAREHYLACAKDPGEALYAAIGDASLVGGYLALVAEAVGLEYLRGPEDGAASLLGWGLLRAAPTLLPRAPAARRTHLLAMLWNLGEAVLREPAWINSYATAMVHAVDDLEKLPEHLVATLDPVLRPRPVSRWQGPFTVEVLDPRALVEDFLPGPMHLAAPTVVCVHDRRREGSQMGVLVPAEGGRRLVGPVPCLGTAHREPAVPTVSVDARGLQVEGRSVALPFLAAPHQSLAALGGFVVASAVDSQRLWVVNAP
ncbi:MAG: hypothetical protein HY909_11165 [Deltaproteobacteria bacterium]|nr:hypothetical protein [Deltaproteobacteria bacterium]